MTVTSASLNRTRAQQFKVLRTGLIGQLYPTRSRSTVDSNGEDEQTLLLSDLLGSFKRFVGNQQTAYDQKFTDDQQIAYDNGSLQSSATRSVNRLERQVDSAIAQAFRKAPGRGATNFITALDAAYPRLSGGQMVVPAKNQTLQNDPNGSNTLKSLTELSTRQLGLYRQISVLAADAYNILSEFSTFTPQADKERVEALRSLIQSQIAILVEEVGRADEPRSARVLATLRSLQEYVVELGEQGYLNDPLLAATIDDENQTTKFEVLTNYIRLMSQTWAKYNNAEKAGQVYSLSGRADRARVLLPILSQANRDLVNALESVGLSETESRSRASLFTTLQSPVIEIGDRGSQLDIRGNETASWLPDITVSDLVDWLNRFSNLEAPGALDSVYGVDFVTDQSDRLFWVIAPIVAYLKTTQALNPSGQSTLAQILSNERVSLSFDNLLSQLNALADLAA